METVVKIKNTADGKKLLTYLKSLSYVQVLGGADEFVSVSDLKRKIKKAEKSRSLSLDEAIQQSEGWKNKFK